MGSSRQHLEEMLGAFAPSLAPPPAAVAATSDNINHPSHYKHAGIETIDVIEAWSLGFCLGNVVKYISRAGSKPGNTELDDLKKARWYLDREIARLEKSNG